MKKDDRWRSVLSHEYLNSDTSSELRVAARLPPVIPVGSISVCVRCV